MPNVDPMGLMGMLIIAQQIIIGVAIGFCIRIVFAGIEFAGELVGMTMGLGFAALYDPISQGRSTPVSQLMALLATALFFAANIHLALIEALIYSFHLMPVGATSGVTGIAGQTSSWAIHIFSSALQLSMPIVAALLVTNAALALLTRAAPQLNIFGVGFPVTISVGMLMLGLSLPYLTEPAIRSMNAGLQTVGTLTEIPRSQRPSASSSSNIVE